MQIRELRHEDLAAYALVYRSAYPGAGFTQDTAEDTLSRRLQEPDMQTYVAVDEADQILGGLTLHDYTIYQNGNELRMCGIGSVCVALEAKKQGVAKFLLSDALQRMVAARYPVSMLYPFRHDFYQNMGWGQVGEMKEFKFSPKNLPSSPERKFVRRYKATDLDGLKKCYDTFARQSNCMGKRPDLNWERRLRIKPDLFVYEQDGEIQGYVNFGFKKHDGAFLINDISIREMIYLNPQAYLGLLGFLASQFDQIESIYYYTRRNDPFHHLLQEPRRENELFNALYHYSQKVGLGWMFRVVDVVQALHSREDYHGANLDVTFVIEDNFLPTNSGSFTLTLTNGKPQVTRGSESKYQVQTDIATFSQIFTDYLPLSQAIFIGKASVNDDTIVAPLEKALSLPEAFHLEFF